MEGPEIQFSEAVIDNGRFGKRVIRFETGRLAKQAAGAAMVYIDEETALLSATTAGKHPREGFDFFPLTVDVEERMYAAGRIPGSFFRREGRPSTEAILACRLMDRPLRPAFVKGLRNEVQIVVTVLSINPDELYDVVAINASSMSTQLSGLPFSGPIGGVRVALVADENGAQWVAFPKHSQLENAVFNMVVAGRIAGDDVAIMMVEAEATDNSWNLIKEQGATAPTEEVVVRGPRGCQAVHQGPLRSTVRPGSPRRQADRRVPGLPGLPGRRLRRCGVRCRRQADRCLPDRRQAGARHRLDELKDEVTSSLAGQFEGREKELSAAFRSVTKQVVRQRILKDQVRIDGRGLTDIRQLTAEVEVLPRVHGSAIFERGETQIMGVTTLNMLKMEQQIDSLSPVTRKRYMHNYNFPPYSTGETGRVGSPKRREIGHGALAERAIMPVLPSREEFPYAIRQVSEALQLQRFDVDGFRLRLDAVPAQRRCAAEGRCCRYRHGPGLRPG